MDEERPVDEAQEASVEENKEPPVSSTETKIVSETPAGKPEEAPMADELVVVGSDANGSDGDESDKGGADAGDAAGKHTGLIIAGIVLVVVLIIAGLLLPPISLAERLGLGGDNEASVAQVGSEDPESADELSTSEAFTLSLNDSPKGVKSETLSHDSFTSGEEGDEWLAAADAIPPYLTLASDVYAIEYKDEAPPVGSAQIAVPGEAQPYQTLDLYGWNGQDWTFIPSQVNAEGNILVSAEGPVPQAMALMQTSKPAEPEIGAEVLPAQELPAAVLPFLSEVTAGTLTLAQEGRLLGELVPVPSGGYRQYLRATNTGAVVDTVSLSALLGNPNARQRNIQELVGRANAASMAGVNLDYQGVDPAQSDAFNSFVDDLAGALHEQDLDLIVTLETPLLKDGQWDTAGQDWQAIGQAADAIYLQMPLDPTLYGDSGEAEQVIVWAVRQIDRYKLSALLSANAIDAVGEARREVESDNALANFGDLELVKGTTELKPGETVEIALSGTAGDLEWDPESLTYKYTYEQADQPHEVWLNSEALLSHQSRLPNRYNVRGLAVRGLGKLVQADGYAAAMDSYLGTGEAPQPSSAAIVWAVEDESGGVIASSSGEDLTFEWEGIDIPGKYIVSADFAQGDNIASLGKLELTVGEAEPTATPEPVEEEVVEGEPTATVVAAAQPANINPGDADAVVNTPANVRKGPGLAFGIIGGLNTGEKVTLTGRNEDVSWYQIQLGDGTEAWIFARLLTINSSLNPSALAVIEVEPPAAVASGGGGAAPAPVIAPAAGGNFELGGQTHSLANPTLMQMAGMNWVKFQHKWGSGDTPEAVAGRIQQAHANGFKVLLSIPGANAYPSNIDFNGYVEFLGGVAALGPDAIEVWNEENIDFEWPVGQIDPASYVNNMLAPAYNAIKSANPNVMVIMGAPAPTGFDNGSNAWSDSRYMAGVAAAGGANYMDCIGVHHNAGATSPSAVSGHPAGNDHYSWFFGPTMNMYYNALGGSRPVCFTELGYLSGEDFGGVPSRFSWAAGTSVGEHAQWLAEAVSLAANSGRVRMVIIFNVDFTQWGDDPQAGYAMLRPDGSCPSCGLLGQVMGG